MKLIFVAPLAALALAGAGAGSYLWVMARGTAEEAPLAQQEATPTPTATPKPALTPTATPMPSLQPQPSPQPVPDDWLTFTDADIGVTLRYPPDWVVKTPLSSTPTLKVYRPLPPPPSLPKAASAPIAALVSVYGCCSPEASEPMFNPWACDAPEKTELAGYVADRCVYTKENPIPGGFTFAGIGMEILYTLHVPGAARYTLPSPSTRGMTPAPYC